MVNGLLIMAVGVIIAGFVVWFGIYLIRDPYEIARDTNSPEGGIRACGVVIAIVGILIAILAKVFVDRIVEPSADDWKLINIASVAVLGIFSGLMLLKHGKSKDTEKKTSATVAKITGIVLLAVAVVFAGIFVWKNFKVPTEKDSNVTCSVCDRTFKEGSDNARSIARNNMCENCYDNFEWRQEVQDYIDNQPVD